MLGNKQNNRLNQILNIKNMLYGKDPNAVYNQLMSTNPQFSNFVNQNKDKSVEQIAQENGIDLNMIRNILR